VSGSCQLCDSGIWIAVVVVVEKIYEIHESDGEKKRVVKEKRVVEQRNAKQYLNDPELGMEKLYAITEHQEFFEGALPCPRCLPGWIPPERRRPQAEPDRKSSIKPRRDGDPVVEDPAPIATEIRGALHLVGDNE
jgi:hypothetical protein